MAPAGAVTVIVPVAVVHVGCVTVDVGATGSSFTVSAIGAAVA